MRVRLQLWSRTVTLVPWHEADGGAVDADAGLSLAELRRLVRDELGVATGLRALLRELGEPVSFVEFDDDELARRVLAQIERGRVRVESRGYEPRASEVAERMDAPVYEPAPAVVAEDPTHWIEVELLDEAGGPVAGERVRITLPSGSERLTRTDRNGLVRLDRIEAGQCTISFPDLDAGATAPLTKVARSGAQTVGPSSAGERIETHWVEVELLDEAGRGVAGELCELTLPSGERIRRRTDARGLIRIPRIADPGECQISFVELDAAVWLDEVPTMLPGAHGVA